MASRHNRKKLDDRDLLHIVGGSRDGPRVELPAHDPARCPRAAKRDAGRKNPIIAAANLTLRPPVVAARAA